MIASKKDFVIYFLDKFQKSSSTKITQKLKELIIKELESSFNFDTCLTLNELEKKLIKEIKGYFFIEISQEKGL